jgi:hypothetical protein
MAMGQDLVWSIESRSWGKHHLDSGVPLTHISYHASHHLHAQSGDPGYLRLRAVPGPQQWLERREWLSVPDGLGPRCI